MEPKRLRPSMYHYLVTFPDRVYPFVSYIDGERVRWSRSYQHTLEQIQDRLGEGRYGLRMSAYRSFFHVLGAGLVIALGTIISHMLWGSDVALPVLFVLAMLVITYQEFILQPRTYQQHLGKGIADWVSWAAPLSIYIFHIF